MLCFYTRSKESTHPQNKTPCSCITLLSLKNMSRIWGYEKIKDAYPKKVCHMLRHVKKKKIKDACPKKVCHMLRYVKKNGDSPLSKKKEKERWCIQRSSCTIHTKISTHLHILIKVYDLFLLWIRSLT